MTANGWLQIFLFLLVTFAVAKPAGLFMARVFAGEKTFLDPLLRPCERLLYKLTGVDETREMRWTEYAVAMLLFSGVSMTAVCDGARAVMAAMESAKIRDGANVSGVQHRGVVHHEYELAGVHAGNHDELPDPNGRAGVSQFHFGGGGHCAGDCADSWHRAPGVEDHRKFLGGHDAAFCGCCCRRAW